MFLYLPRRNYIFHKSELYSLIFKLWVTPIAKFIYRFGTLPDHLPEIRADIAQSLPLDQ